MEAPRFSNGWLAGFKQRYNLKQRLRPGESGGVDDSAIAEHLLAVQTTIQNLHPSDVYNYDETGLF